MSEWVHDTMHPPTTPKDIEEEEEDGQGGGVEIGGPA
jgi:hypothetical protein